MNKFLPTCPICGTSSKCTNSYGSHQIRKCRNDHKFALRQDMTWRPVVKKGRQEFVWLPYSASLTCSGIESVPA